MLGCPQTEARIDGQWPQTLLPARPRLEPHYGSTRGVRRRSPLTAQSRTAATYSQLRYPRRQKHFPQFSRFAALVLQQYHSLSPASHHHAYLPTCYESYSSCSVMQFSGSCDRCFLPIVSSPYTKSTTTPSYHQLRCVKVFPHLCTTCHRNQLRLV